MCPFNSIQDGRFRDCSRMRGNQKSPPSLKAITHIIQWLNLAQLKKYMNHVTHHLTSADISIFSPKISNFCLSRNNIIST